MERQDNRKGNELVEDVDDRQIMEKLLFDSVRRVSLTNWPNRTVNLTARNEEEDCCEDG